MQIAKSAEETRKKSSKNSDFEFGSFIGGAECHFAEFLFFAVKQATIPDYTDFGNLSLVTKQEK